jgi:O-antigen/teichoic acid export membrane protein
MQGRVNIKLFIKSIMGFSLASWIQAAINLVSIPIVTRIFPTEEYGKISIFINVYTILTLCVRLSLEQGYTRYYFEYDESGRKKILSECVFLNFLSFLVVVLLIILVHPTLSNMILGENNRTVICVFLPIIILCNTLIEYARVSMKMSENVRGFFVISVLTVFAGKLSMMLAAITIANYYYAIFFMSVSFVCELIVIIVFIQDAFKGLQVPRQLPDAKKLITYSFPFFISSILVYIHTFITSIILKSQLSFSSVAIFSATNSVANVMAIIEAGFSVYWGPFMYKNYQNEQKFIKKMHSWITMAAACFYMLILIFNDLIFRILGDNYRRGKNIFAFLLIPHVMTLISETTVYGSYINKKSIHTVYASIISIICNVALAYILIPQLGLIGAALAVCISSIVVFSIRTILGQREYRSVDSIRDTVITFLLIVCTAFMDCYIESSSLKKCLFVFCLIFLFIIYKKNIVRFLKIKFDR